MRRATAGQRQPWPVHALAWGVLGVALSAWPGAAFVGSVELLMGMVRRTRSAAPAPDTSVPGPPAALNGHGEAAAELFAGDLAEGRVPGVRRIRREMHLGQPRAQQVREYLAGLAGTGAP